MPESSKPALRQTLRAGRPDMASQREQSAAIRELLRSLLSGHPAEVIACFAALPGEPDLLPLLPDFPDRRWVLPRIMGDTMNFHDADPTSLSEGSFGIQEPPSSAPLCPVDDIDLFLCPGMAFTRDGKRLGRGKGYYDRALARAAPESERIGVCFREQLLPDLPTEPHDLTMHLVITPDESAS